MGCGSSKQVEIGAASQPTEKVLKKRKSVEISPIERESGTDTVSSSSCINQENGESLTRNECPSSDAAKRELTQASDDKPIVKSSYVDDKTESYHSPPQDTNDTFNNLSRAAEDGVVSSKKYNTDYRQLFRIIKTAVYLHDIQQIISLKNNIEAKKEDIQSAAFQNDGNLPPIPEDEENLENPRRVRPARNLCRENAENIALEVSTVYRILENGGVYKKDTVEIERLKNHYGRLQEYLINVNA